MSVGKRSTGAAFRPSKQPHRNCGSSSRCPAASEEESQRLEARRGRESAEKETA